MKTNEIIHKLRNAYGTNRRKVRLEAANDIEHWKDAYEKMRDWAIKNGPDINVYSKETR